MSDPTITFSILAVIVAVFVWDRLPVRMVAVGTALSLWATGVLDYERVAEAGDPPVIFKASLFVLSDSLYPASSGAAARRWSPPSFSRCWWPAGIYRTP